jgi:hypothetical protein
VCTAWPGFTAVPRHAEGCVLRDRVGVTEGMTRPTTPLARHLLTRSDLARLQVPAGRILGWLASGDLEQVGTLPGEDSGGDPVFCVVPRDLCAELATRLAAIGKEDVVFSPLRVRSLLLRAILQAKRAPRAVADEISPPVSIDDDPLQHHLMNTDLAEVLQEAAADLEHDVEAVLQLAREEVRQEVDELASAPATLTAADAAIADPEATADESPDADAAERSDPDGEWFDPSDLLDDLEVGAEPGASGEGATSPAPLDPNAPVVTQVEAEAEVEAAGTVEAAASLEPGAEAAAAVGEASSATCVAGAAEVRSAEEAPVMQTELAEEPSGQEEPLAVHEVDEVLVEPEPPATPAPDPDPVPELIERSPAAALDAIFGADPEPVHADVGAADAVGAGGTVDESVADEQAVAVPRSNAQPTAAAASFRAADVDTERIVEQVTGRTMARVESFLGELRGTVTQLTDRPAAPVVDLNPLVQAVEAGFTVSAKQAGILTAALTALSDQVGGVERRLSVPPPARTAEAPMFAPLPGLVATRTDRSTMVLLAVGVLLVAWTAMFWFKTGDAKLAISTLVGANAVGCCLLLARR